MIAGRRVLAIIPARGGSKGVPRKNIRVAGGQPLIAWTIRAALASAYIDKLIVSSEDDEIRSVAAGFGADLPLRRPPELATDDATSLDVVLNVLDAARGFDLGVLLQPTSPLRTSDDIDSCLSLTVRSGATSCIAVTEVVESPFWMYSVGADGRLSPVVPGKRFERRQDLPSIYRPNGALYVFQPDWLRQNGQFVDEQTIAYIMPGSRSLDIDTEADFARFEQLAR
jgi:N-acylneuraminate cytidylyltransferase